jgi:hypothetical protein
MNSSNTTRAGSEPAQLVRRARDGKPAIVIRHATTSDGPDGQPWLPPDSNTLWAVVRRADGCTHWRAIEIAQSDRCHGLCNSAEAAAPAMRGSNYDEG